MRKRTVFVIGLDDRNRRLFQTIRNAERYDIRGLLTREEVEHRDTYPIDAMLAAAAEALRRFPGTVDGLVNYIDFPGNSMAAVLAAEFGLRGPSLEAVLRCEHKAWSRLAQAEILPGYEPRHTAFDPCDDDALERIGLPFPFWVKPVKAFGGYLGFRVESRRGFDRALSEIRANIGRLAEPFDRMLDRVRLPGPVAHVRGRWCLAEEIVRGRQCTVEGHVLNGDPRVHGIVDSFRYPHRSSFASYHYPTQLPKRVRVLLAGLAVRCVRHLGLDNAGFNVEFFWDQQHDRITILEVNPRISQSHCALFEMVDGASSHQIALAVALGEEPDFPAGEGRFRSAARYFLRHTGDAMVARIPTPDELVALERDMPGVKVEIAVPAGRRLSDRTYHDSYSYKLAEICVGGEAHADIERKYRACVARLPFELIGQRAPREREPQS